MKTRHIFFTILLLVFFTACEDEVIVDPQFSLSFEEQGFENAFAGTTFYVKVKGSAEFLTLYDGKPGAEWDSIGAKGVDFNLADSLPVTYPTAGTYNLTVVATTTSDFGKSIQRRTKTVPITVIDIRNEFNSFVMNGVTGTITADKQILFSFPDNITDFNFKPVFTVNSPDAKVYVSGEEQTSGVSVQNFSPGNPVVYTVKSRDGEENIYTVYVSTFPASNEKQLLSLQLFPNSPNLGYTNSNGEIATIDETNKEINLALNYGTNATSVRLTVSSSPKSTVLLNGIPYSSTRRYNLTTLTGVEVVAENSTKQFYKLILTTQDPVIEFTFEGLVPAPVGVIDKNNKTITIDVLKVTDITKLKAKWTGSVGTVKIGNVTQINGVTENDFSTPLVYTFYKGTSVGDSYTVIVIKK